MCLSSCSPLLSWNQIKIFLDTVFIQNILNSSLEAIHAEPKKRLNKPKANKCPLNNAAELPALKSSTCLQKLSKMFIYRNCNNIPYFKSNCKKYVLWLFSVSFFKPTEGIAPNFKTRLIYLITNLLHLPNLLTAEAVLQREFLCSTKPTNTPIFVANISFLWFLVCIFSCKFHKSFYFFATCYKYLDFPIQIDIDLRLKKSWIRSFKFSC